MEIVSCPSCGTKARVPSDRGLIKVKCPSCATHYFHPATFEVSEVQFRCSRDGATFVVTARRHQPDDRFTIHRIAPLAVSGSRQLAPEGTATASDGPHQAIHPANQYDWSGFYCPCCGYIPRAEDTDFVQCGTCRGLVCGESVTRNVETGTKHFRCYPACGAQGEITGSIEKYAGEERTETNRPQYASIAGEKRERLSGPRSTLPAGQRKG